MPAEVARRLFFALWPDDETAAVLHATAVGAQPECGGRPTARSDLHLTLAFLGDVAPVRCSVAEAAAADVEVSGFEFSVDRLGWWKHNRILWAGCSVSPPPLQTLAQSLAANLRRAGFALESRAFAAHVTLLRNARCGRVPQLAQALRWRAAEFVLAESKPGCGVRYASLRRWPLRAPG